MTGHEKGLPTLLAIRSYICSNYCTYLCVAPENRPGTTYRGDGRSRLMVDQGLLSLKPADDLGI